VHSKKITGNWERARILHAGVSWYHQKPAEDFADLELGTAQSEETSTISAPRDPWGLLRRGWTALKRPVYRCFGAEDEEFVDLELGNGLETSTRESSVKFESLAMKQPEEPEPSPAIALNPVRFRRIQKLTEKDLQDLHALRSTETFNIVTSTHLEECKAGEWILDNPVVVDFGVFNIIVPQIPEKILRLVSIASLEALTYLNDNEISVILDSDLEASDISIYLDPRMDPQQISSIKISMDHSKLTRPGRYRRNGLGRILHYCVTRVPNGRPVPDIETYDLAVLFPEYAYQFGVSEKLRDFVCDFFWYSHRGRGKTSSSLKKSINYPTIIETPEDFEEPERYR
jgi:hypothetical protein